MSAQDGILFDQPFFENLQQLVNTHHAVYPYIPPQGIYFESLVERAFLRSGWPREQVALTNPNSPRADLNVGTVRLSLKTETGAITRRNSISITKLCTTETGTWDSVSLIEHTIAHLDRYDHILMLRAIWEGEETIDYQLVEIPLEVLRLMRLGEALPVGNRQGRRSLAFDVVEGTQTLFRVHFDGADGKCQIRKLRLDRCRLLLEWRITVRP
jgi:Type II site-specific deoxyribonuclease